MLLQAMLLAVESTVPDKLRQDVPPPLPPRSDCAWTVDSGQWGGDIDSARVSHKEECCALCWANPACHAADLASPNSTGGGICHLKAENSPATRNDGSISCVPKLPPAKPSTLARPTPEQLAWQDLELGVHIPLTMGEYGELQDDYACGNQSVPLPSPDMFRPERMNATKWMESVQALGGKYAVLTVQTGCGFLLHHTKSTLPDGKPCTAWPLLCTIVDCVDVLIVFQARHTTTPSRSRHCSGHVTCWGSLSRLRARWGFAPGFTTW